MRSLAFMLTLAALASACTVPIEARADSKSDAKQAIQSAYDQSDQALAKPDLDGVFAVYSPDFVTIAGQAEIKGTDKPRRLFSYLTTAGKSLKAASEIADITSDGKDWTTAIVTVTHRYTAASDGNKLVVETTDRDFWVKTDGGWKLKREKPLNSTVRINGQAVGDGADDLPDTTPSTNLSGNWQAQSPIAGTYEVHVAQFGDRIVATKLTASRFVPAGAVTWYGVCSGNAFPAKQQIAGNGHEAPAWEDASVAATSPDSFTLTRAGKAPVTYAREVLK